MNPVPSKIISVRQLLQNEDIPYSLLLLADEAVEAIDRYIHDAEIYVYEKDDRIIAVYVLQVIDAYGIEIKNIAVETGHQGKGLGTALLMNATENAAGRGFKSLFIGTGDQSLRELALYKRSGFKEFKVIKDFFITNYPETIYENGKQLVDMIMLKKDL